MATDPTLPSNINSDDAAIFAANQTDDSTDDEDTEDPVGRGASKAGQLDMFRSTPPRPVPFGRIHGGYATPRAHGFQHTPGASQHPDIA